MRSIRKHGSGRVRPSGWLAGLLVLLLSMVVAGLLWLAVVSVLVIPARLHPPLSDTELAGLTGRERLEAEDARRQRQNETRSTLLQATGALLLLTSAGVGAWFTGRQLHLNREGQITERFTRAVDQLGSDQLDVRLGGIYALERIAHDSAADQGTIVEVLSAYVRQHAPLPTSPATPVDSSLDDPSVAVADAEPGVAEDELPTLQSRAADVQAAMTVLGRRPATARSPDLPRVDLRRADLRGANLQGANLQGANLQWATLKGANLEYANLENADLYHGNFERGDLRGAKLRSANLQNGFLNYATLRYADLFLADLRGAKLVGAILRDANLQFAKLRGAYLLGANLQDADLRGARLHGVDLEAVFLRGAIGLRQSAQSPLGSSEVSERPEQVNGD
jgi:uncharacterized protein YjbI with pentapeptide repeats